jgi:hypothetical protein
MNTIDDNYITLLRYSVKPHAVTSAIKAEDKSRGESGGIVMCQ